MPQTAKIKEKGPALKVVKEPKKEMPAATTNQPDRETFHYFVGQIDAQDELVKGAQKKRKDVRRLASDAGINLEVLDLVRRKRDKEPETAGGWMQNLLQAFKWMGIKPAVQLEMFEEDQTKITAEMRAEQEGYVDGLEGKPATDHEGRYNPTVPEGQARLRGWAKGQNVLQERFLDKQATE